MCRRHPTKDVLTYRMDKALLFPGTKGDLRKAGLKDDDSGCSQWPNGS